MMLFPNPFSEFDTKENKIKCEIQQGDKKSKTPYKMQIFKGYKNVMIRRDFATFLIHHPVAKKMEEFMHDTIVPDEHIYATMSRIKHIDEITIMNCGKYKYMQIHANTCEECPQGYSEDWCSGDCVFKNEKCVPKSKSKISSYKFQVISPDTVKSQVLSHVTI